MKDLDRQGWLMPAFGFGTFELTGVMCRKAARTALDAVYRHIDTAHFTPSVVERALAHAPICSQIVPRWHMQPERVAAIPRASDEDHIRENRDICEFWLSGEEMLTLSGLARDARRIDPAWAPWGS